ncbi:hypothetical protein AB0H58_26625 [Nocardia neocaledoniensis]|uniref:hypothetical protein n=1 Tax=Nocardia neocaledoniensis TaxID=236511 RepID=UPI0033E3F149
MDQRFLMGGLIAGGAFAALIAASAPPAMAQQVAPGIDCELFTCTNTTDDPHRVDAVVWCTEGASARGSAYVAGRGSATIAAACPTITKLGTPEPPRWERQSDGSYDYTYPAPPAPVTVRTTPVRIEYVGAEVDRAPLSTGS